MSSGSGVVHWGHASRTVIGDNPSFASWDYPSETVSKSTSRTPGYPNAPLLPLPYSTLRVSVELGSYSKHSEGSPQWGWQHSVYSEWGTYFVDPSSSIWYSGEPEVDYGLLLTQSANSANQAVKNQTMNVGLAVGEAHQTIGMISKRVKSIASAARNLRKGKVTQALRDLSVNLPSAVTAPKLNKLQRRQLRNSKNTQVPTERQFSDAWLELEFGWRPLVNDCVDLMKTMDTRLAQRPAYCFATGRKKASFSSKKAKVDKVEVSFGLAAWHTQWVDRIDTTEAFAVTGYIFSITNPSISALQQLGLSNAAALAWEATPFSFVVDWFVNVGDVIDTMDAWYGKDFVSGYQTYGRITTNKLVPGSSDYSYLPGSGASAHASVTGGTRRLVEMQRSVLTSPVSSRFVLNIPTSSWHGATAISLLTQLFK